MNGMGELSEDVLRKQLTVTKTLILLATSSPRSHIMSRLGSEFDKFAKFRGENSMEIGAKTNTFEGSLHPGYFSESPVT
jgi:hypothetical protein